MNEQHRTKTAVSVTEMAKMLGLSRSRFYQLMGTTFPKPSYDKKTRRPYFTEEQQETCLEVRRRNCGIDGKPILFYARRNHISSPAPRPKKKRPKPKTINQHADLIESLKTLGLEATSSQVSAALKELYPGGTENVDESEIIKAVFLHIQRQNSSDNVG